MIRQTTFTEISDNNIGGRTIYWQSFSILLKLSRYNSKKTYTFRTPNVMNMVTIKKISKTYTEEE